jgi:hypothetical protein
MLTIVTDGRGEARTALSRIYDRLRKKSYRRTVGLPHPLPYGARGRHQAYVDGVRDALKAIEQDVGPLL